MNSTWNLTQDLVNKYLQQDKVDFFKEGHYILTKNQYFCNFLLNSLQVISQQKDNYLLIDTLTQEQYIVYYNELLQAICVQKENVIDLKNETKILEMFLSFDKQFFMTLQNDLLRIDKLYSYTQLDISTDFYNFENVKNFLMENPYYQSLWQLISSNQFQSQVKPDLNIASFIQSNVFAIPKQQRIEITWPTKDKVITNYRVNDSLTPLEKHNDATKNEAIKLIRKKSEQN